MDQASSIRKDLIRALVSILSQGIQDNQLDDSEKLLAAISILNPELECIDEFKSYIAIKRGFIKEALQVYISSPAETSKWYVMMALCLKLAEDPTWHSHATRSLELQDPSSQYSHTLARVLLGIESSETPTQDPNDKTGGKQQPPGEYPDSYMNYLAV